MFDFGRKRELHVADAIAVAASVPANVRAKPKRLTDERTLLASDPHFVFERIELAPGATLRLEADRETWLLVVVGGGQAGKFEVVTGDAVFAQSEAVDIQAGLEGMASLVAYTGISGPVPHLLQSLAQPSSTDEARPKGIQLAAPVSETKPSMAHGHMGAMR